MEEWRVKYNRLTERVNQLAKKYTINVERYNWDETTVEIGFYFEKGLIPEKVAEKHSKEVKHYCYTPEDMSTPLESYHYILFRCKEKELEVVFKEVKKMYKEVEESVKKFNDSILKTAGLLE